MASTKASLLLAFTLLFFTGFARQQQFQQQQNQCQIRNIEALQPENILQAEAGVTEFWNPNNQQFQCAGVEFVRHRIQPGGLLLPSYVNSPILALIESGQGVQGVILPGCPETYESSQQQQYSQGQRGGQSGQFQDRHQKVENLYQGDLVAIPTGAAHWLHNDGNSELVVVVFFDVQNKENQLDQNHRRFFLAGNPQAQSQQEQQQPRRRQEQGQQEQQQPRRQQEQGQQEQQQPRRRQEQGQGHQFQPYQNSGNIFNGFPTEVLQEAFNVDRETAEKLRGQNDQRGHIVNVGRELQVIRPSQTRQGEQEYGRRGTGGQGGRRGGQGEQGGRRGGQDEQGGRRGGGGWSNGIEETICTLKLKENIDNPSHVDFANPQAGRISNLNSFKFPVLGLLQLSAARGELHPNAIQSPHWIFNAHNLIYVTDGTMRVQIVNNEGNSVFDDELQQGQVVVVPQNFAVVKKAGEQGCRWVSFRTNDNAMISNLAGRVSAIRSLPVDVVANIYQVPIEDAQRLKFSQQETVLFTPRSRFSTGQKIASA